MAAIAAAFFQTARFMLQKVLSTGRLSVAGATFARFVYSMPVIWVLVGLFGVVTHTQVPQITPKFWIMAPIGGVTQILATLCVVALFQSRNFAVGVAFKKTEVIQIACVSAVVLGEMVSWVGFGAILVGLVGVMLMSDHGAHADRGGNRFFNRATGLGVLSGFLFAISGVAYRGASLEIVTDQAFVRAALTLLVVVTWQTVVMFVWLWLRDRPELLAVWRARKTAVWVGLTSMAGSYMWFVAFTLQNAAYVKAVGQIELIFSILASRLFFREKMTWREFLGIVTITGSVLILVAYGQ